MTKYLEFDSTYRDRNQDPNPASFLVGISQTGQLNRTYAVDPVCYPAPIYITSLNFLGGDGFEGLQTTDFFASIALVQRNGNIYLCSISSIFGPVEFPSQNDFYVGTVFHITIGGIACRRRIIKYEYINATTAYFTLQTKLPDGVSADDGWIDNPSPFPTNTPNETIQFFLPSSSTIDGYYNNYYVTNHYINIPIFFGETAQIKFYDGTLHLATFYGPTTVDWVDFQYASNPFSVRKQIPTYSYYTVNIPQGTSQPLQVILNSNASTMSTYYNGSYFQILRSTSTIIESGRILNYIASNIIVDRYEGTSEQGTLYLTEASSSSIDGYYNGVNMILQLPGTSGPQCLLNIDVYDGTTHSALVSRIANPSYDPLTIIEPGWDSFVRSIFCVNNFTSLTGVFYEVANFSFDNYTPFSFTGSLIQQGTISFYEIELINLVLPNLLLEKGGIIAKYPYVYVELEQITEPSSLKYTLYSNNPNSVKTLFRAVVDDTTQPLYSSFIKMDGDGMVHKIWFKPVDYFRISIRYPNGELFKTVLQDTTSPVIPDPSVQISACFAIRLIN